MRPKKKQRVLTSFFKVKVKTETEKGDIPSQEEFDRALEITPSGEKITPVATATSSVPAMVSEPIVSVKPSDRVVVSIEYRKDKEPVKVYGRPHGLMKGEGDHATAFAVAVRAIRKIFAQDITSDSLLEREPLTQVRKRLYNVASALGALKEGEHKNLFAGIAEVLEEYNQDRFSKTTLERIRKKYVEGEEDEDLDDLIEHTHKTNAKALVESLENVSELLLSSFNKLPNTAFPKIKGYEAPDSEGSEIRTALSRLDTLSVGAGGFFKKGANYTNKIAEHINTVFFYPHINEGVLATQTGNIKRDNTMETFEKVLAKHIFLCAQAYPELFYNDKVNREELIGKFIEKSIEKGKWGEEILKQGSSQDKIIKNVKEKFSALDKSKEENDFEDSSQHDGAASSDEEKEPSAGVRSPMGRKLTPRSSPDLGKLV